MLLPAYQGEYELQPENPPARARPSRKIFAGYANLGRPTRESGTDQGVLTAPVSQGGRKEERQQWSLKELACTSPDKQARPLPL